MKYQEVIEKVLFHFPSKHSPAHEVLVYKNPSHSEFLRIVEKSPYQELRGLTNNHVVYVWDGALATHIEVMPYIDNVVDLGKFEISGNAVYSADKTKDDEYFRNHDMIKRMMGTL